MFPHGLMFHHFHGSTHRPVQGSISVDDFERIIDYYGTDRILGADEWLDRLIGKALQPEHVCITFDDSLKCQYDVAYPLLKKRRIKAFWFCYSSPLTGEFNRLEIYRTYRTTRFETIDAFYEAFASFVTNTRYGDPVHRGLRGFQPSSYMKEWPFYTDGDRIFRFVRDDILGPDAYQEVMDDMIASTGPTLSSLAKGLWITESDLRDLSDHGHVIGLHSHSHPTKFERLDPETQFREYQLNSQYLEAISGRKPTTMSHPSNSYNSDTLEMLKKLGVILGFRANMAMPAPSDLEFPREDHANIMAEIGA